MRIGDHRRDITLWRRREYVSYAALSVTSVGLSSFARLADARLFSRFIGAADPIVVTIAITGLGAMLLFVLEIRDGFAVVRSAPTSGLWQSAGVAAVFGILMIAIDFAIVFPADVNVPFPQSVVFYPVIGFSVEILFHVLPLALLLTVLPIVFRNGKRETILWASVLLVALLEPTFQVATMVMESPIIGTSRAYPSWAVAYVGLHVFAINLCQLVIFRRYGFISMYAVRLMYYVVWHMVWGHARLTVLF